ncbi:DUF2066 domain-containing protein [Dyella jiangningensis]|uniref:DUF2066 domain-containing protein n=1 Tax=Dyella jiangningensis TaxID=1379159 RepID=A0A328P6F1_9GAMM|nr:DUF2066 domain-containing protein [Dyella jiangningensis]RAO77180.1 hypothetical protein CA260_04615 [Dyella jiangningensis]
MRLSRLLLVCLVLGLAPLLSVHAQGQVSPYTVVVSVADTSDVARNNAFSDALAQVLARTAGGQDLSSKPGYSDVLKGASGIVKQYQYQRAATGMSLQVTFDEAAVQRTIAQLGVAGSGPKPPVLLVVRDEDGSVLTRDALAPLAQAVAARGYATVLADPGKTGDTPNLTTADPDQVAALARQYKTGLILLGQLHGNSADWMLVSGGPQQRWNNNGANTGAVLTDAGNGLADRLGKQLNVIGSATVDGKLWVSQVNSAMDYANLLSTLRADPSVRQVTTVGAQGDGMLFAVKASLPMDVLAANLAASGRLLRGESHSDADISLRWVH